MPRIINKAVQPVTSETLRAIEVALSEPLFEGIAVGLTLGNALLINLLNGRGDWSVLTRMMNYLRRVRRVNQPLYNAEPPVSMMSDRVLVTLMSENFRCSELVFPVLHAFMPENCVVLTRNRDMVVKVPPDFNMMCWDQLLAFDAVEWRVAFRRIWPIWRRRIAEVVRREDLPPAVGTWLTFLVTLHSQYLFACRTFFQRNKPRAVLVEFDRDSLWACLVLAARQAGVPTYTLMHGVVAEGAVGYVPCLADAVFCWGAFDQGKLAAAGEPLEKLILAGCPRQSREFAVLSGEARKRLGLSVEERVVVFGTAPSLQSEMFVLAGIFASAMRNVRNTRAVLRLHPSESPEKYQSIWKANPELVCWSGPSFPLDTCLCAADIVVVQCSGLGGDALVKRRPVVVLDTSERSSGYAKDLITEAGCPHARNARELTAILGCLLDDTVERERLLAMAERFVTRSYAAFGMDAAQRIAHYVLSNTVAKRWQIEKN